MGAGGMRRETTPCGSVSTAGVSAHFLPDVMAVD